MTERLSRESCDVWTVDLGVDANAHARLEVLDAIEQARAARLRFQRDRERFCTCRAALRLILGRYLGLEPGALIFETGEYGKPTLPNHPVEFNVSHSADLALIAIAAQGPLGVDIEALRDVRDPIELAARYFHPEERRIVDASPPESQNSVFLTCWTRKEAVLKSMGIGLTLDTRRMKVGATPVDHTMKLAWRESRHQVRVRSFEPAPGYVAACVTPHAIAAIEFRRFDAHGV